MNISDIRTKIDAQNERTHFVTRGAQVSTPAETVLTLVDSAEPKEPDSSMMTDPLIQALVDRLSVPNSIWSIDDRAKRWRWYSISSTGPRKLRSRTQVHLH
jgi:hypothetical protein